MRVLVADDSASIRALVKGVLEAGRKDVSVVEAEDGEVALEAMRRGVDLAVLDWGMPKRDGLDVLRTARAEHIATPVLILTAFVDPAREAEARRAGAADFVPKPFRIAELMARLKALM